ncbi:MAG: hypothetical protein M1825_006280 [Sarcosagium campestre]|nr:MAG: hypothetical protein M1825_006280 [Sarcosagium campestre]
MLCAISGEAPQEPVASRKNGNVFEKRLIEAYIAENHKDPVTGDELSVDDLVELKSARIVRPRPPTLTSIPSLLSVFQNEWDALALETYTLRQQLAQTRQELSSALYQHDAAVRVIARMKRERDEARDALSKVTINVGGNTTNGDSMHLDPQELPEKLAAQVDATQEKLSKTRRKRSTPAGWATVESIEAYKLSHASKILGPGPSIVAIDASGDSALICGHDGSVVVYSLAANSITQNYGPQDAAVTDGLWWGTKAIIANSKGQVKILENGGELITLSSHAGATTALALHPSGEILASVGVDKSYVIYDLSSLKAVAQIYSDTALAAAAFHPDGHIFAAGSTKGEIKIFDVKSGANAANFASAGPIKSLSFSENGTWLATASEGSTSVSIWDLRKASEIKSIEIGSAVENVRWDYTGQFLAATGNGGTVVQAYSKSTKQWSEPLRNAEAGFALQWGHLAQSLVLVAVDGTVKVLKST